MNLLKQFLLLSCILYIHFLQRMLSVLLKSNKLLICVTISLWDCLQIKKISIFSQWHNEAFNYITTHSSIRLCYRSRLMSQISILTGVFFAKNYQISHWVAVQSWWRRWWGSGGDNGEVFFLNGNSCSIFAFSSSCWTGLRLHFANANFMQMPIFLLESTHLQPQFVDFNH